jgi:hypothetical protein
VATATTAQPSASKNPMTIVAARRVTYLSLLLKEVFKRRRIKRWQIAGWPNTESSIKMHRTTFTVY